MRQVAGRLSVRLAVLLFASGLWPTASARNDPDPDILAVITWNNTSEEQ
jgi:hypothetical protein